MQVPVSVLFQSLNEFILNVGFKRNTQIKLTMKEIKGFENPIALLRILYEP
jgi:hypothetical protein